MGSLRSRFPARVLCVSVLFGLHTGASTALAQDPITGELSEPGYTVIALAADGEAQTVTPQAAAFSVVPPAATVTVHLRAPDGTYAGPVVIEERTGEVRRAKAHVRRARARLRRLKRKLRAARRAADSARDGRAARKATQRLKKARKSRNRASRRLKRARRRLAEARQQEAERRIRVILGVKAGAPLGDVEVKPAGYAVARGLRRRSSQGWVNPDRRAWAKDGEPIGAGNFGFVQSRPFTGAVSGDLDLDAVPDPLDIDDDGDLVLDNVDPSPAGSARVAQAEPEFTVGSSMPFEIFQTRNANASSLTVADIDEALSRWGSLGLAILPGDSNELDCGGTPNPVAPPPPLVGGLTYCSYGGTARVPGCNSPSEGPDVSCPRYPEDCCDPDGDGFGTLSQTPGLPAPAMLLFHGATTAQIRTGDVLIQRVTTGGVEREYPATLQFVFATVPALVSYSDTAGNSGTVSYPVEDSSQPGARGDGFPVAAGADGDVVLTLTFWRPQRTPIAAETGEWIDIGGLTYAPGIADIGFNCPQSTISENDPNLVPAMPDGFTDLAGDQAADPANTFTYTVNLTQCLAATGLSFDAGENRTFAFNVLAPSGADTANQFVTFRRQ